MPIDKEFLSTQFQGVENADDRIGAIIAEYEKEKLPILKNRDDIIAEKKAVEKQLADFKEKQSVLEAANKELGDKLQSGLPDKEKEFFQTEIDKLKVSVNNSASEYNKMKADYEDKVASLSREKTEYIIGEEFTKLLNANSAIFPAMREGLRKRFFADYPKLSFEPYDYNGKTEYVNKDHQQKKMSDMLNEFLNTEEGKHYVEAKSNGGGAPGGSNSGNTGGGIPRSQFDQLSYHERSAYIKKGGKVHG
jgi:hypothetical protein